MTGRGTRRRLRPSRVLLTLGAIVGGLCLLLALAGLAGGVRPLVFQSGSMAPEIPAGSVGLVRPVDAADLAVGDVVSVHTDDGTRVTHRVVGAEPSGAQVALTLRGDANPVNDAEVYRVARADRLLVSVPWVGHAVAFLGRPVGLFLLGGLSAGLLVYAFRPTRPAAAGGRAQRVVVLVPTAAALLLGQSADGTQAAFSDAGAVRAGNVAAHTVGAPVAASCRSTGLSLSATVSWPETDPRHDYQVVLRRVDNGAVVSSRDVTGTATSTTYAGLTDFGLVVGLGTVDFQVEIRSFLAGTPGWRSSGVHTYSAIRVAAIVLGATVTCSPA